MHISKIQNEFDMYLRAVNYFLFFNIPIDFRLTCIQCMHCLIKIQITRAISNMIHILENYLRWFMYFIQHSSKVAVGISITLFVEPACG